MEMKEEDKKRRRKGRIFSTVFLFRVMAAGEEYLGMLRSDFLVFGGCCGELVLLHLLHLSLADLRSTKWSNKPCYAGISPLYIHAKFSVALFPKSIVLIGN